MPRPPQPCSRVARIPGAVFSPIEHKLSRQSGELFPLHVGDTWLEPFPGARMENLSVAEHPGMHRYNDTRGLSALIDVLVEKARNTNGLPAERESVLVTGGATGALCAGLGTMMDPGEEVLILSPFWPLIRGIVQTFGGVPVEVPFYDRVDSPESACAAVRERIGRGTVALYVSTPSNPTGMVLPRDWLIALAELAIEEDLWILSDEVYEDLVYRGTHVSVGSFAPERTLSVFSFSKSYGMAGNRVGYLVGPPELVTQARKVSTHTVYAAPTASQYGALRALEGGRSWLGQARESYRAAGEDAAATLGLPPPEGSTFLFLDVGHRLDERGIFGFLEDCLADGVVLAPGPSCGAAYEDRVRLCYTAAPPDRVAEAVRRLAKRI